MDSNTENSSRKRAEWRLDQIVTHLIAKHPRAAKDPALASLISDLGDIIEYEVVDKDATPQCCPSCDGHSCPAAE